MELCEKLVIEIKNKKMDKEDGWKIFINKLQQVRNDIKSDQLPIEIKNSSGIDFNFYEKFCFDLFTRAVKDTLFKAGFVFLY